MPVKYLRKAEDGAAVPGLEDFDPMALLAAEADQAKLENMIGLITLLSQLGGQSQGGMQQIPVAAMLGAQNDRAALLANSMHEDAQYLPGLNPGGLFDAMTNLASKYGGGSPVFMEEGARKVNRVPLDSLGSSFGDAVGMANQSMVATPGAAAGPYDEQIGTMVQQLIAQIMGTSEAAGADASTPTTFGDQADAAPELSDPANLWEQTIGPDSMSSAQPRKKLQGNMNYMTGDTSWGHTNIPNPLDLISTILGSFSKGRPPSVTNLW